MNHKAIRVVLTIGTPNKHAVMVAYCIGERTIQRKLVDLPVSQPAHALAKLMCHQNKWIDNDLVYGLLPNGDEVFCFRNNGRG